MHTDRCNTVIVSDSSYPNPVGTKTKFGFQKLEF